MPAPTAHEIIALRWKVRVVLRLAAVALLLVALGWASMRYSDYRYDQAMFAAGKILGPITILHPSYFGIPAVLGGLSLACVLLGQFALRLLVPVPKAKCPGCGYDLSEPTSDRCPECGLRIGVSRAPSRANDPA